MVHYDWQHIGETWLRFHIMAGKKLLDLFAVGVGVDNHYADCDACHHDDGPHIFGKIGR